jgi:hypothetical protein
MKQIQSHFYNNNQLVIAEAEQSSSSETDSIEQNSTSATISNLLHSPGLNLSIRNNLTEDEQLWLKQSIQKSRRNKTYVCHLCKKELKSYFAISYHFKNLHLKKQISKENIWVSKKIQEGSRIAMNKNDEIITEWICVECKKAYCNQPGLRYHMQKHYRMKYSD